jgi:hypothetical protein
LLPLRHAVRDCVVVPFVCDKDVLLQFKARWPVDHAQGKAHASLSV